MKEILETVLYLLTFLLVIYSFYTVRNVNKAIRKLKEIMEEDVCETFSRNCDID